MLRSSIVVAVILLHSGLADAQWSSFKPVTEDLLPEDQRDIREQTVVRGKVTAKEIRVDWYGFTLKDDSNIVEDRFQYPVADPTLAPGDKIIRVQTKDVADAADVTAALRATSDKSPVAVTLEREVDGETKAVRISLHRANSLILKGIFDRDIGILPPPLRRGNAGVWGAVFSVDLRVIAVADNGERVCNGAILPTIGKPIDTGNVVLRGWKLSPLEAGGIPELWLRGTNPKHQVPPEAVTLMGFSGSSGNPKQQLHGGAGFLFDIAAESRRAGSA